MDHGRRTAESCFQTADSEILIGGVPATVLANRFETPFYAYDLDRLAGTYHALRKSLHDDIALFYSVKANPSLAICSVYRELGAGAEIASQGELATVIRAGFPAERIVFAGPGKRENELESALQTGILAINVESLEELSCIGRIARRLHKTAGICLRVNPEENVSGSHLQMGGGTSPFGLDEELLSEAIERITADPHLEFRGIHVYVGNQILHSAAAMQNIEKTLDTAREAAAAAGLENGLKLVNLGGGLGIPYYPHQSPLDVDRFSQELNRCIASVRQEPCFKQTTFILELGRYLVADCGVFFTRVVTVKESRGERFAVVDGGMNANSLATGNLGQMIRRKFPIVPAASIDTPFTERYTIVGPLCTPMDTYGSGYAGPPLQTGDLLCVLLSGAYGRTASPTGFLSHPGCQEIAASGGTAQRVRRPETINETLSAQALFDPRHTE